MKNSKSTRTSKRQSSSLTENERTLQQIASDATRPATAEEVAELLREEIETYDMPEAHPRHIVALRTAIRAMQGEPVKRENGKPLRVRFVGEDGGELGSIALPGALERHLAAQAAQRGTSIEAQIVANLLAAKRAATAAA